ncbi:MAG: TPM domain-containing protein [Bacteroidales bacterium]
MKIINKISVLILLVVLVFSSLSVTAQIVSKPSVPHAVNDFADVLTSNQKITLERRLVDFSNSTKTRIVIVTITDLKNLTPFDYAYQLGEKWGIGDAKFDNGIVILVKPKDKGDIGTSPSARISTDYKGQVFIAVGYGLESVIPDAIAKRIVNLKMIPAFKQGDYFSGFIAAIDVIMPLAKGEYSATEWQKSTQKSTKGIMTIVILLIIVFFILYGISDAKAKQSINSGKPNGKFWIGLNQVLSMLVEVLFWIVIFGGRGGGGGNSGGGSSGFSGGFGGGSFGGGGAGGSW